jgi:tetratricopeptide (TPR) repeat protein
MARTRTETRTYTLAQAASVLGTSEARVLELIDAGLPEQSAAVRRPDAPALSFQDLVVLRHAKRLVEQALPPARLAEALRQSRARLPAVPASARPLEARTRPSAPRKARGTTDASQAILDFGDVPPVRIRGGPAAEQLFVEAQALEDPDPARARTLYAQLLTMTPDNADAHVNLGRLLHEVGRLAEARDHYRAALSLRPRDATAAYNLAVSLGDEGRTAEAMQWYHLSLEADPGLAEAHYNLACLHERRGQAVLALRHLKEYRRLAG